MPKFAYSCGADGIFETYAGRDDSYMDCPVCHQPARRRPFSGIPNLKGETVARSIPDPNYRLEREKRDLAGRGWTEERSLETIRKNVHTDTQGFRHLDVAAMNREGAT